MRVYNAEQVEVPDSYAGLLRLLRFAYSGVVAAKGNNEVGGANVQRRVVCKVLRCMLRLDSSLPSCSCCRLCAMWWLLVVVLRSTGAAGRHGCG